MMGGHDGTRSNPYRSASCARPSALTPWQAMKTRGTSQDPAVVLSGTAAGFPAVTLSYAAAAARDISWTAPHGQPPMVAVMAPSVPRQRQPPPPTAVPFLIRAANSAQASPLNFSTGDEVPSLPARTATPWPHVPASRHSPPAQNDDGRQFAASMHEPFPAHREDARQPVMVTGPVCQPSALRRSRAMKQQ